MGFHGDVMGFHGDFLRFHGDLKGFLGPRKRFYNSIINFSVLTWTFQILGNSRNSRK